MRIELEFELDKPEFCNGCLLLHSPGGGILANCLLGYQIPRARTFEESGRTVIQRPGECQMRNGR